MFALESLCKVVRQLVFGGSGISELSIGVAIKIAKTVLKTDAKDVKVFCNWLMAPVLVAQGAQDMIQAILTFVSPALQIVSDVLSLETKTLVPHVLKAIIFMSSKVNKLVKKFQIMGLLFKKEKLSVGTVLIQTPQIAQGYWDGESPRP